ncbi:MAG: DUF4350 domain-containing protein [Phycisphaerales bacterium]
MRSFTNLLQILCMSAALVWSSVAGASVVVTQVEERAFFSLWLLSQHSQQNIAHNLIIDNHDVVVVPEFTAETLAGADVVYVSPAYDELQITQPEIEALEQFVIGGGRLVLPGDYGMWVAELAPIAEHFGVIYGDSFVNGLHQANVIDFDNPITDGPEGVVEAITGAAINDNLHSKNPAFRELATWQVGPVSIGFMELGAGEIVFLSDFNTFDNDMLNDLDNQTLWLNLFEYAVCPADLDDNGSVGASDLLSLLVSWGPCPPKADCPADFDGNGTVGASDLLALLANWGPCP